MGEPIEIKSKDGRVLFRNLQKLEGILAVEQFTPGRLERYKKLLELKHKEGDIIIANYPKTGTHWLLDSIAMLKRGKAEIVHQAGFEGFLDAFETFENIEQQESPRLLFTHLFPCHLSEDLRQKAKFIILLRNPKDTAVSMFHLLRRDVLHNHDITWDDFVDVFLREEGPPCSFFKYYRHWEDFISSHKDQVLIVYYEDMHKDYDKQLRRISDFTGIEISDETIAAIRKKATIQSIKEELYKDPEVLAFAKKFVSDGDLVFQRKGIVGDWKNHFTVAQNEWANDVIEKETDGSMFRFDFTV